MPPKQWFTGASGKIALISIGVVAGLGLVVGGFVWVASDFAVSPSAGRTSTMNPPASTSPSLPSATASPPAPSAAAVAPQPPPAPARVRRSDPPAPQIAPPPPPAPSSALPPGLVVPSPIGKAYELKCTRPGSATYGTVHSVDCTLDGWLNLPTQVPIYFGSGIGLPGSCINTQALTAVPPVIDRAPLQPPTPFRVLLDTTRAGCGGCTGRVSFSSGASPPFTPPPAGDFIFTIIIEGAPTPHSPNCGA
jgi:hypothetical protein